MDSSLWSGRRGSCLVRSRLTAIPHFASWTLSNRKTASASARSRSNPLNKASLYWGSPPIIKPVFTIIKLEMVGVEPTSIVDKN